MTQIELDDIDTLILDILMKDSRAKLVTIAKAVNKNESTVRKRIENLRASGVIKRFTAEINPAKLGYNVVALVGVDVETQIYLKVAEAILKLESEECRLISVHTATGAYMIMFEIWAPDATALFRFIKTKVEPIEGITRVNPAMLFERLEPGYVPGSD